MGYRIGTVAEMTGIPRTTLLAWERRHGFVLPDRNESGYREYSDDQVETLHRVKALIDEGYRISEAISLLDDQEESSDASELAQSLRDHLMSFDQAEALRVGNRVRWLAHKQVLESVYLPLIRSLDEDWRSGEVTDTQEHFSATFLRDQVISLIETCSGAHEGPIVACLGFPGQRAEIVLLAFAVRLAVEGWRVRYIGPTDTLADLDLESAELVLVSLTQHVDTLAQLAPLEADAPLAIGGPGVASLPKAMAIAVHDPDALISSLRKSNRF